jgi:hypothetical protein
MNKTRWSIVLFLVFVLAFSALPLVLAQDGGIEATVRQFTFVRLLPDNNATNFGRL